MASVPDAVVAVTELRKSYRSGLFRRQFAALKGLSLEVERGEIFALLGPNGAGKTTLIKILLGIVRATSGTARLLGMPAGDRRSRQRVGYLPENLRIAPHHTAYTALDLFGRLSGLSRQRIRDQGENLLDQVGLLDRAGESVRKYSKGMLQRLGLAQALLHEPELLILDEPTDGLDPLGRSQVRSLLLRLKQRGTTVFLNSHILQEVELVCDRVAILDKGLLRAIGTVDEIAPASASGLELSLELAGPESAVRAALGERGVREFHSDGDLHTLEMRLLDQGAVDLLLDDLRQASVSIVGLRRRRLSLEDAFLRLLASPGQVASSVTASGH